MLKEFGLIVLMRHFRQRHSFRYLNMWTRVRQGTVLRVRCDYIIGKDHRLFKIVGIR